MKTVKFSALAVVAIVAGLVFLPAADPLRLEAPAGQATPAEPEADWNRPRSSGYPVEPVLAAVAGIDGSSRPVADAAGSAAIAPVPAQPIDWLMTLYPGLARISELEDAPAAAALAEFVPMLANEDPVIRLAAIEAVGDMTIAAVLPVLSMALRDPDPQVRVMALEALAARGDDSVSGDIEPCLYDQDPEVRLAAIDALAALEAETAVYALASLLSDPEASIRRNTVDALGDIGGEGAMRYLTQARYDPDEGVRANAEAILAELNYAANR